MEYIHIRVVETRLVMIKYRAIHGYIPLNIEIARWQRKEFPEKTFEYSQKKKKKRWLISNIH